MAELKIPLIRRAPRTMNRQGNKRTTKEGPSDLKFQNFALPKNRSWPPVSSATGQYQYRTVEETIPRCDRKTTTVLDTATFPSDDDYEDPELQLGDVWPSVKILPARPIKESEYADTRCFKGAADAPSLQHAKPSAPPAGRSQNTRLLQLEEVGRRISRDIRSQHAKGDKHMQENKTPLPPPRPPPTLPKKYQPLPPTPWKGHTPTLRQNNFPEAQREPRQISLKDLSEVLQAEKVSHHQIKPESSHLSQNQNTQKTPLPVTSSTFLLRSHNVQERVQKGSVQSCSPSRCQPPASCGPTESILPSANTGWRKPFPPRSAVKGVQHNEWYIGEHSRQVVEEALLQESKDGTFLVRDCSTKSTAEPYVLVVFHGNKVYNVKIRFLEGNRKFALGTGLRGDEKFDSVEDIIEHYKYFPITLIDGKDKSGIRREQCYLTQPLPLARRFSPW
ncbi:cytokine-dependent hematopoietic cell linker isoform X2 [Fukomys damarensis]|uniref:cytokine-dependent hematopoietic cell linker isoform X2 n=1 Tax=Fukomys damarensis TaxID=885580 RepID=UPI00054006FC|nr:cytokine-dependent hematopoietic cell linker isoform X2 [Fukomys damarensis]